jgi:hypothetical protein
MAGSVQGFNPAGTVTIAASTTSATAALAGGGDAVLVYNATNGIAFVVLGAAVATAAGVPVPAGARMLLACPGTVTNVAVILATGATPGNVYFTSGAGTAY